MPEIRELDASPHQFQPPIAATGLGAECARGYSLTRLEMDGVFPLTVAAIGEQLTQMSPGNYALGYMDGGSFVVMFVGRSDADVRSRLQEWVGAGSEYRAYAPSGRAPWGVHRAGNVPLDGPALAIVCHADSSYSHFAYSYAPSADAAYAKHWRNYDDFGGDERRLDNTMAPAA